jgi:hypothetical protein
MLMDGKRVRSCIIILNMALTKGWRKATQATMTLIRPRRQLHLNLIILMAARALGNVPFVANTARRFRFVREDN